MRYLRYDSRDTRYASCPSHPTLYPSTLTFYPSPTTINLAAALAFKTYYTQHIVISFYIGQSYFHTVPQALNLGSRVTSDERRTTSAQKKSILQNKPNFQFTQILVKSLLKKDYKNRTLGERGKNKPNSNPIFTHRSLGEGGQTQFTECPK